MSTIKKIKCCLCNFECEVITWKHLKKHNITLQEYKNLFPGSPLITPEAHERKKQSAKRANASRVGKPRSKETIEKIRLTKLKNPTIPWNFGVPMSEELKQKLSKVMKEKYAKGEIIHWNTGKQTSQETKEKIRLTLLSKKITHSEERKEKRRKTIDEKKKQGWVHHSTLRKGVPRDISDNAKEIIRQTLLKNNNAKKLEKIKRIKDYLDKFGLVVESVSEDGYLFNIKCNNCNTQFTRTVSVLAPSRYDLYQGQYCPTCFPVYTGYYSSDFFEKNPDMKNVRACFYVACLYSNTNDETFIKVGITTRNAHARLIQETAYSFEVIIELQTSLIEAFNIEQSILQQTLKYKYYPNNSFGGMTECFSLDGLEQIFDILECYLTNNNIVTFV